MTLSTRLRWFRFSVQTMLVLVTLVCVYLGWAMNWIRQRQAFIKMQGPSVSLYQGASKNAPFSIRLLGAKGYTTIWLMPEQVEKGRELFPEAEFHEVRPPNTKSRTPASTSPASLHRSD